MGHAEAAAVVRPEQTGLSVGASPDGVPLQGVVDALRLKRLAQRK